MSVRSTDLASPFFDRFLRTQDQGTNPPRLNGLSATGGVVSEYTTPPGVIYKAHIFTGSGTFTVSAIGDFGSTVDITNVAGGGGGV